MSKEIRARLHLSDEMQVSIVSRNAGKQSKGHYAAASRSKAIEAMKQAWWPQGAPEPFPYQVVASVIEK